MTRTIDFDAFRAERKAEPVEVIIGGEHFLLAADMPAEVALEIVALRKEYGDDATVPVEKIEDLARALFGSDTFDALIHKHRLSADELGVLVTSVFGQYNRAMVPNPTARKGKTTRKPRTASVSA